jgi:hypothetical protein
LDSNANCSAACFSENPKMDLSLDGKSKVEHNAKAITQMDTALRIRPPGLLWRVQDSPGAGIRLALTNQMLNSLTNLFFAKLKHLRFVVFPYKIA